MKFVGRQLLGRGRHNFWE